MSPSSKLSKYSLKKKSAGPELEPHEVLYYAEKHRQDPHEGEFWEERLELPIRNGAFFLLFVLIFGVLLVLVSRFVYLELFQGTSYATLSRVNTDRAYPLHAPRGIIYDRNGEILARNRKTYDVLFDGRIQESALREEELDLSSEILGIPPEILQARIEEAGAGTVVLARDASQETFLRVNATLNPLSGIRVEPNYVRTYSDPYSLSHVVGYTGYVGENDLLRNPDLSFQDLVGKSGIELAYDEFVRGKNGKVITKINSRNEVWGGVTTEEPTPGNDLLLNIDGALQEKIYDVFRKRKISRGAGIVLEAATGRVLALVSIPGYDTNALSTGIEFEAFERIVEDPREPLFARAISGQYPPGSTLKPLIALAALEENIIDPNRYIYAEGAIFVPHIYTPEIVYRFSDWKEHGYVNMVKALAFSSNVYFYHIGGGFGDIVGLGIEKMVGYLGRFGFGKVLGIDIGGEASGLLPTPEWKKQAKGEGWYIGDTYNISIGQGDISLTPLHLAATTAAIANGGTLFKPQVVNAILDDEGSIYREFSPEVIRRYAVSRRNVGVIQEGMREAVRSGSSKLLADLPINVAGKTGTAEVSKKKKPHAWWTGFAPYEDPKIVLTILVENGGEGSVAAVPIAKEILGWYFGAR